MSAAARTFVTIALVTSALLTGCGGTPSAVPTPAEVDTPIATPNAPASPESPGSPASPDAPAPADPPATADPTPIAKPVENLPPSEPQPPASVAPPALSTVAVTPAGLGPLQLGAVAPDQGEPSAMVVWDPDYCAEFPHPQGGSTGAFLANYPTTVSPALGTRAPFTIVTTDGDPNGTIGSVIVFSPEITTVEGVGVGTARAALMATYPSFAEQRSAMLSDAYVVDGDTGRLAFEVAKRPAPPLDDYWSDEVVDTVLWMMVVPHGTPAPTIAGSDAGGPCAI